MLNLQAKTRSGASIEAHYDIGNDLYTRMLDPRMVYTCAYWKDARTWSPRRRPSSTSSCRRSASTRHARARPRLRLGRLASWAAEQYGCTSSA